MLRRLWLKPIGSCFGDRSLPTILGLTAKCNSGAGSAPGSSKVAPRTRPGLVMGAAFLREGAFVKIVACNDTTELGKQAAALGIGWIGQAISEKGSANVVLGTGPSQFGLFDALKAAEGVDWSRVNLFHLDEYLAIEESHQASFRGMLRRMVVEQLSPQPRAFYVNGRADVDEELRRLAALIEEHPLDVAFLGIGENGHLAFNDPPADFETRQPFIAVDLALSCKQQQVGEGHFASPDDVPPRAITMSIHCMMAAKHIICAVPDERKAEAVRRAVEGPVTNECPASILQRHPDATVFLEPGSMSRLSGQSR